MSSLFNDPEDTPLRTRREQAEYASEHSAAMYAPEKDREVTLNTGMVLALFFALVLVCAVFFGFGYSIGHKSGMATATASAPAEPTADSAANIDAAPIVDANKPAAGSPAVPSYVPKTSTAEQAAAKAPETHTATAEAAPAVRTPPPAAADTPAATPAPATGGSIYVQIAAVSHQEDADVLLSALGRRGYKVITRSEPADKLIHVQIGPYANRKDADAMKAKLLTDGYNAFIK